MNLSSQLMLFPRLGAVDENKNDPTAGACPASYSAKLSTARGENGAMYVSKALHLIEDGPGDLFATMADVHDNRPAAGIQIPPTVLVLDPDARSLGGSGQRLVQTTGKDKTGHDKTSTFKPGPGLSENVVAEGRPANKLTAKKC
jgi:hypothetical protein